MRALTVTCSNACWSTDVYMDDGNTIDPEKMHPYAAAQRGRYLYGTHYDDCYAIDENSWHIEGLSLESYENGFVTNYEFEASGDISFDGNDYLISNVKMEYAKYATDEDGNIDVWGGIERGTWGHYFSEEPFRVSPSLVEGND